MEVAIRGQDFEYGSLQTKVAVSKRAITDKAGRVHWRSVMARANLDKVTRRLEIPRSGYNGSRDSDPKP